MTFKNEIIDNDDTPDNLRLTSKKTGDFAQMRSGNVSPQFKGDLLFS
jgi:hypothetical protein